MSYVAQKKQNCFIDKVCMQVRGRGARSGQKRSYIFFRKVHTRETWNQKIGLFHVRTLRMAP